MKVTWDADARALYVTLIEGVVNVKTEDLVPGVMLDKTLLGQICGIEILNVELVPIERSEV